MVTTLFKPTPNVDRYIQALDSIYASGQTRLWDPNYPLQQDPDIYERVHRDPVLDGALAFRGHLVAGKKYVLTPASDIEIDVRSASVMDTLIRTGVQDFSNSRFTLTRAIWQGSAWTLNTGRRIPFKVTGDTAARDWWMPIQMHDIDHRRFAQFRPKGNSRLPYVWHLYSIERRAWEPITNPEWFTRVVYNNEEMTLNHGRGLLNSIYFYLYSKAVTLEYGLKGAQRWSIGLLKAAVDGAREADTGKPNIEVVNSWKKLLKELIEDDIVVHDKLDEIEVVQPPAGTGGAVIQGLTDYFDARIVSRVLGANLPTLADKGGSFALAGIQENSTEMLVSFDRDLLAERLTKSLVKLTWMMNRQNLIDMGLGEARMPRFNIIQEKREDPQKWATIFATILNAGAEIKEEEFFEKLSLTPPKKGDKVIKGPTGAGLIPGATPPAPPRF